MSLSQLTVLACLVAFFCLFFSSRPFCLTFSTDFVCILDQVVARCFASHERKTFVFTKRRKKEEKALFDPRGRSTVVIIVFAHVIRSYVRPSVRPHFSQNKTNFKRKQCSLLARRWVWPSGSLMTPALFLFVFVEMFLEYFYEKKGPSQQQQVVLCRIHGDGKIELKMGDPSC